MKFFGAIVLALVAAASAAPSGSQKDAQITAYSADVQPNGYQYGIATSNGITAQEVGQVQGSGEQEVMKTQGQYSYTAPDGQVITVTYIADENGFQPQGAHIPKP